MRHSASRKKTSERTEQTESGDVEVNFEEEDLATNIDEESEDEGKKITMTVCNKDLFSQLLLIYMEISNYVVFNIIYAYKLLINNSLSYIMEIFFYQM